MTLPESANSKVALTFNLRQRGFLEVETPKLYIDS